MKAKIFLTLQQLFKTNQAYRKDMVWENDDDVSDV